MGLHASHLGSHTLSLPGSVLFHMPGEGKGRHKASGESPQNISLESCHRVLSAAVTPAPPVPTIHMSHPDFADAIPSASNALPSRGWGCGWGPNLADSCSPTGHSFIPSVREAGLASGVLTTPRTSVDRPSARIC